jgi:hypothetical protein
VLCHSISAATTALLLLVLPLLLLLSVLVHTAAAVTAYLCLTYHCTVMHGCTLVYVLRRACVCCALLVTGAVSCVSWYWSLWSC